MTKLIGLPLETARALLAEQGVSSDKIVILETAPSRAERSDGSWRVLRCLSKGETYEVLVAREQLSETRRST